ncbi:MAG: IS1 family transposase [Pseudomonadota bacterium]
MNRLPTKDRVQILKMLVEGNSIRGTARIADVSKNTVTKVLVDAGKACAAYHDKHVRKLTCERVQVDEIWSFTYAKAKNVPNAKAAPEEAGDTWTWTALDADTKLIVSYLVGDRDTEYAEAFIYDIQDRVDGRFQLTSDGLSLYREAVDLVYGPHRIDFAMLQKIYSTDPRAARGRYSPAVCTGADKKRVFGNPDPKHISTSYVERQNLTMRMAMRRFTRLTNAFSKKLQNHAHAVALHFMHYNFVRIHKSLRVTPAMAAGVTDRLWDIEDIVKLMDEAEPAPKKRGPYKKRGQADAENSN